MNGGVPPTDLNDRTGLLTPPGMYFWASANSASDLLSCMPRPDYIIWFLECLEQVSYPSVGALGAAANTPYTDST